MTYVASHTKHTDMQEERHSRHGARRTDRRTGGHTRRAPGRFRVRDAATWDGMGVAFVGRVSYSYLSIGVGW